MDGFNVYHSIVETRREVGVDCRWLDLRSLCRSALQLIGPDARLEQIHYFGALAHHLERKRPGTVAHHERFIDALRTTGVTSRLGVFKPIDVRYRSRTCEVLLRRHEEKETDVAIAAAIVESAAQGDCAALTVVSGDTGLLPAFDAARRLRPELRLFCLFPPYRSNQAFRSHADALFKISPRQLPGHLLPDPVLAADGRRLAKPTTW